MSDQALLLFVGTLFVVGWAAIIVVLVLTSVRIFPKMPSAIVLILGLLIAVSGFLAIPYLYAAILAFTIIVSGFAGGVGIGLVRMRGIFAERAHIALAVLAIALEALRFSGFGQVGFILRIVTLIGLVLLLSVDHVRSVLARIVGGASRLMILVMLGASALVLPMLLPSFTLLLDGATITGLVLGISLNYVFFARII